MAWLYLFTAVAEVTCTTLYRYTGNLSRLWPSCRRPSPSASPASTSSTAPAHDPDRHR